VIIEIRHHSHIQRMTYDDFEDRVRDGEISGDTPIRFEVVTGDAFVPAHDLELYQVLASAPERGFRRALLRPGLPLVTAILLGFQIRVYLWSWVPATETWLQDHFTNWAPAVLEEGEIWRLFSYGLLHLNFAHLLFNLCFLGYTAYHLERAAGRANLLTVYFGSVFTGGILSMLLTPDRQSLGASGGVYGLLAAAIVIGWKYWDSLPVQSRKYFGWAIAFYLGLSFVTALRAENVDHWSHLGGLIGGGALMTVLEPERLSRQTLHNRVWRLGAVGAMAVLSLGLALGGTWVVPLQALGDLDDEGWTVSRPTYWKSGWTFTGDRGWFSPTLGATFAATTTVHPRPLTADAAVHNLVTRIGSGSRNPRVLRDEPIALAGWEARQVQLRFDLSGEEQEVTAIVMARGVYEHRVQFQSVAAAADHYQPLVTRIRDSVAFEEVPELVDARARALTHPRSYGPAVALGLALYRSGQALEALQAYGHAHELRPTEPDALVGLLRVHADYSVPGGIDVAHEALATRPDHPGVIVACADAIAASGNQAEAEQVLDDAWARLPGDRQLRVARLNFGLSVALPGDEER
jgi:membrane associated rhomboid family serine protease